MLVTDRGSCLCALDSWGPQFPRPPVPCPSARVRARPSAGERLLCPVLVSTGHLCACHAPSTEVEQEGACPCLGARDVIPDQGLLQSHQRSVDGHRDHRQVEIVEHDGDLVVQASARVEVQAECPAADHGGPCHVPQPGRQASELPESWRLTSARQPRPGRPPAAHASSCPSPASAAWYRLFFPQLASGKTEARRREDRHHCCSLAGLLSLTPCPCQRLEGTWTPSRLCPTGPLPGRPSTHTASPGRYPTLHCLCKSVLPTPLLPLNLGKVTNSSSRPQGLAQYTANCGRRSNAC